MFEELIRIADALDEAGFAKEANEIDQELERAKRDVAEQSLGATIPINNNQKNEINIDALKESFFKALSNTPFSEQASQIVGILDSAVKQFMPINRDRRKGQPKDTVFLSPQGATLASNIANLESDILQLQQKQKNASEEDQAIIEREIKSDQQKLQTQYKILEEHLAKYPKESEKIYRYIDSKKQNRTSPLSLKVERRVGE